MIGAYREHELIAPMLFEGNCNSAVFNRWLERMRFATIEHRQRDRASFHKSQRTRQLVGQTGCRLLYLPPYSPDLNPIEKLLANLKRRWRKAEGSLDELILMSNY